MTATFEDGLIDRFIARRVCARCYGDLWRRPTDDRRWRAECPNCLEAWGGATISRYYAESKGQKALAELSEVRHNLPDLFPDPHKGKTDKQLLSELGL